VHRLYVEPEADRSSEKTRPFRVPFEIPPNFSTFIHRQG
jgi:hypothetical protein